MFLSEDEARYDDILKLFYHYKTLANNSTMTKFTTLWESILFPKLTDNYYYPNIRYSKKWNKQYIEHYLIKETSPTADWEINFNVNNIHALITNGDILPEYRKFKSIKQYIFLWKPSSENNVIHPKRSGIAVQYFLNQTTLFLIDGNHRAIRSNTSWFYNFELCVLHEFDMTIRCFDSYVDFLSYHWITSKQYLNQLNNVEDAECFLQHLEAFLQENQKNMSNGLLNPYTANE